MQYEKNDVIESDYYAKDIINLLKCSKENKPLFYMCKNMYTYMIHIIKIIFI